MAVLPAPLAFFLGGDGSPVFEPVVETSSDFCVEVRVRFPLDGDENLSPTELSGSIWTLSSGSSMISTWYQKDSITGTTGTIYVTSSAGVLSLQSAPIFDDKFYALSLATNFSSGTMTLRAMRHDAGIETYSTSSLVDQIVAFPHPFTQVEIGSSALRPSRGQFWAQEFRVWKDSLSETELKDHSMHFESYGRDRSFNNSQLRLHLRLNDGVSADSSGSISVANSVPESVTGSGANFTPSVTPFKKFIEDYAYIPSIDYGWNQKKVRTFDGPKVDPELAYQDERTLSLEFNMYDALNEDISHMMSSYDELTNFIGLPVNKYREDYEGLIQMRETYFKRLQGPLNFTRFVDMLDFFDSSFTKMVEKLLPARADFKGDEMIVESHMLERPKFQYQLRQVIEGRIEISGSISITDQL